MKPSGLDAVMERMTRGVEVLGSRLPKVVGDVRAYPREAMLLALIAALALILCAVLVFVVSDAVAARKRVPKARSRMLWRTRATRALTLIGTAGALVVVAAMAPLLTEVSSRCTGSCHGVEPAAAAWRMGSHSRVGCYGCHARPGPTGALEAGMRGVVRALASEDASMPGVSPTDNRVCLRCHDDIASTVVGRRVRMRHADVVAAAYPCAACHADVAHEGLAGAKSSAAASMMGECVACHDGKRARSRCGVCHAVSPADRRSSPVGHTALEVTCSGCHPDATERRCVACHGLELPHPADFPGRHASLSSRDPSLCARCHESARPALACACHTEENLHGTYTSWFPQHGSMATRTGGGCRCHEDSFCDFCHAEPGVPGR